MTTKVPIALAVGWNVEGEVMYRACGDSRNPATDDEKYVRQWIEHDGAKGVRVFTVEAEVDLPQIPAAVERVQGVARGV